jgi:hypothetical protein
MIALIENGVAVVINIIQAEEEVFTKNKPV